MSEPTTMEELDRIEAEQRRCLPSWRPAPGEDDPDDDRTRPRAALAACPRCGRQRFCSHGGGLCKTCGERARRARRRKERRNDA